MFLKKSSLCSAHRFILPALVAVLLGPPLAAAQDEPQGAAGDAPDSEITRFEDWGVECRQPPSEETKRCIMFQRQVLEDGRTLLVLTVRKAPDDRPPLAILQLPLGVLLEPGVSLSVDGGEPRELRYRLCDEGGCIVTFLLDEALQNAFRQGQNARVVVVTADQRRVNVDVSLSGFTAAFNAL
ncbi:MAG TPA: invasion associated locus B family protein [Arenicellales bacterium]|nr:invasion associated locus B family protein [Arenicellales bacterium]